MKMETAVSSKMLEQLKLEDGNCIVCRNLRIASVLKMANTSAMRIEQFQQLQHAMGMNPGE
jgi:hypothetical protein